MQIDPDGTAGASGFTPLVTVNGIAPDGWTIGQNLLIPELVAIAPQPLPNPNFPIFSSLLG